MYTLITRTVLKHHRISTKTIRKESVLLNDLTSLMQVPANSKVLIFFDHSISVSYLMDLRSALNLDVTLVVNSPEDYNLCEPVFNTKLVTYDFIDGALIKGIMLNDERQVEALTKNKRLGLTETSTLGLIEEAKKLLVSQSASEMAKMVASAFINHTSVDSSLSSDNAAMKAIISELSQKNIALGAALSEMSKDTDDFIQAYSQLQTQISARNVIDVIKDNSSLTLPSSLTSLVIKNFGIPHLMNFVSALKDSLTTSYDKHTKVIYVCEPDGVSLHEINRSGFFLLSGSVQASDILKNDMFICVGNVRTPIEFLVNTSTLDVLIVIDSRRTPAQLISGQTMTLYTAMDLDVATNLGLDHNYTITSSERSLYTLREADFVRKKRHALRNNDLVTRVVNSLLEGGR